MKKLLNIILLLASSTMAGESLLQAYETAYRLETEERQPDEAAKIYRKLVAAEATGEDRYAIAQAAKRLIAIYRREERQAMDEKIEALKAAPTIVDHVIETFGEPLAYTNRDIVYDNDNLPLIFNMDYPQKLSFSIMALNRITTINLGFGKSLCDFHGICIGSKKHTVLDVFPPERFEKKTRSHKPVEGVFYAGGSHSTSYYKTKYGISFFLADDFVFSMAIMDLNLLRSYTPPAKAEIVK